MPVVGPFLSLLLLTPHDRYWLGVGAQPTEVVARLLGMPLSGRVPAAPGASRPLLALSTLCNPSPSFPQAKSESSR